jgi:hypothetical protein
MVDPFAAVFPKLVGANHQITSPPSEVYNCIAWAAQDTSHWWWPDNAPGTYWPLSATRAESLSAFQEAFASQGYSVCQSADLEAGYDKIAVFAHDAIPTHAARQLPSGRWTSKLGLLEDIEHDLSDLEGHAYGHIAFVMKRSMPQ